MGKLANGTKRKKSTSKRRRDKPRRKIEVESREPTPLTITESQGMSQLEEDKRASEAFGARLYAYRVSLREAHGFEDEQGVTRYHVTLANEVHVVATNSDHASSLAEGYALHRDPGQSPTERRRAIMQVVVDSVERLHPIHALPCSSEEV